MRKISSDLTEIYVLWNIIFCGIILPIVGLNTLVESVSKQARLTEIVFGGVLLAGFIYLMLRWSLKLKTVHIKDDVLVISKIFGNRTSKEIRLDEIEEAYQGFFQRSNPETVTIVFKHETEFGKTIKFMATLRFFPLFKHPIVSEINRLTTSSQDHKPN